MTFASPQSWSIHPSVSIAPEKPLPAPYGQKIIRVSDYRDNSDSLRQEAAAAELDPEDIERHNAVIGELESRGGAYEPRLVQTLQSLGEIYQSLDNHTAAIEAFKRAMHLTRINQGLFTPEQIPLLRGIIASRLAAGMFEAVDQNQDYLYRVQHYNNTELTPAMLEASREYSEWQRAVYLSGIDGDSYQRLLQMHDVHTRDIERMEAKDKNDPRLVPHLYRLLETEYLLSKYEGERRPRFEVNIEQSSNMHFPSTLEEARFKNLRKSIFRRGRTLLERIAELHAGQAQDTGVELARAKVALGDWYLWFDWSTRARQCYEEAYALLADQPEMAATLRDLFGEPVELPPVPVFRADPKLVPVNLPGRALVSYQVSNNGRARKVEVLELQPKDSRGARLSLLRLLRDMRFRPRVDAGTAVATTDVVREYYFDY